MSGGPDANTLVQHIPNWHYCVDDAMVAIEAMREPTDEMVEQGDGYLDGTEHFVKRARDVWVAMLSTALR